MRIQRIYIENFRNFRQVDVTLDTHAVVVGENKTGKSNLLYALRLILDPSLPDSARQLQDTDFWDGLPRPLTQEAVITITVDLADFEDDTNLLAVLAEHVVQGVPMVARLTYQFQPQAHVSKPASNADYEFMIYGGGRKENHVGYELRRRMPLDILHALRDAEGDLATWRRSPLRPLLDRVAGRIPSQELQDIADNITQTTNMVRDHAEIAGLERNITERIQQMVGSTHGMMPSLSFSPTDPDRLIRAIRLYIDGGQRSIAEASLGTANIIFVALKLLELQQLVVEGSRDHTFFGIEEPEAHLHPHVQRLMYRDLLQGFGANRANPDDLIANQTILLTTHSPHIASIAPLRSLVLLRHQRDQATTVITSTAGLDLRDEEIADLERYLDVTRGELLFARGILFVEGDAEVFLLPALARKVDVNLDELGITVCSIVGTHFLPYIKLVRAKGLDIPFAVLTDLDPQDDGPPLGHKRAADLVAALLDDQSSYSETQLVARASEFGVFLNNRTLETELFTSGFHESIGMTLIELSENQALQARARGWQTDPSTVDPDQLLKDINSIGKGRFAQRLASHLHEPVCPSYIREAIFYVAKRC